MKRSYVSKRNFSFCAYSHSIGSGYVLLHHVMGGVEGKQGAWAYPEGGTLYSHYKPEVLNH